MTSLRLLDGDQPATSAIRRRSVEIQARQRFVRQGATEDF